MKEIITDIEINASAERVWQVLTDFAAYPQWTRSSGGQRGKPRRGRGSRYTSSPLVHKG